MHEYLLLEEIAEIARAPVETVRAWIRSGRLASVKPGRRRLVRRADFEQFLARDGLVERRASEASATATAARSADGRFLPAADSGHDD
jgi:excisionase family DNA binding protein